GLWELVKSRHGSRLADRGRPGPGVAPRLGQDREAVLIERRATPGRQGAASLRSPRSTPTPALPKGVCHATDALFCPPGPVWHLGPLGAAEGTKIVRARRPAKRSQGREESANQ